MWNRLALALLTVTWLAGCAAPSEPVPSTNPYPALLDSPIRGLTSEEIESIQSGAGMSLALPAELNAYPGPKHVLELAEELGLDDSQQSAFEQLFNQTNADARDVGASLLDAYRNLDELFRSGTADEAALEAATDEIGLLEGELRLVHLRAHLRALPLLSEHQRAMYMELRGYGEADHGQHEH